MTTVKTYKGHDVPEGATHFSGVGDLFYRDTGMWNYWSPVELCWRPSCNSVETDDERCVRLPQNPEAYMPKVGEECLWFSDKTQVWTHTKLIAIHESSAWLEGEAVVSIDYSYEQFRPIKTEREKTEQWAFDQWLAYNGTMNTFCGHLYNLGALTIPETTE